MSTQIDATPFCDIAIKSGRPRVGKEKRVCFTSCTVTPATLAQMGRWTVVFDQSRGAVLDALVAYALASGFAQKKGAGAITTSPPAPQFPTLKPQRAAMAPSVKPKPVSQSSRHAK